LKKIVIITSTPGRRHSAILHFRVGGAALAQWRNEEKINEKAKDLRFAHQPEQPFENPGANPTTCSKLTTTTPAL
jgi:hypothetical protein